MDNNNQSENIGTNLGENLTNNGEQIAKSAGSTGLSAAKWGVKQAGKALKKAAKEGAKATAKATAKAALSFGIYGAIAFLILFVLIYWWNYSTYSYRSENMLYQTEVDTITTVERNQYGDVTGVSTSFENEVAMLYYTKYSTESYYYTVDDNPTVKQGSIDSEIKDIENREKSMVLSPQLLTVLDQHLNGDYIYPQQFIKPVYNTCSTGESTNGICETKPLIVDGELQPTADKYEMISYEEQSEKFVTVSENVYQKVEGEQETSIADYGLAPIFHYVSYKEEYQVQDFKITEISYKENGKVITKSIDEVDSSLLLDLGINNKGQYADFNTSKYGITIPKAETKYYIDQAATLVGTLKNEVEFNWEFSEVVSSTYDKTITRTVTVPESDYDLPVEKTVHFANGTTFTTKEPLDIVSGIDYCLNNPTGMYPQYCTNTYGSHKFIRVNGYYQDMGEASKVKVTRKVTTKYTMKREGDLMIKKARYTNLVPNTDELGGLDYLEDYIDNYELRMNAEDVANTQQFACYRPTDQSIVEDLKDANYYTLSTISASRFASIGTNLERIDNKVYDSPSQCPNGTIAMTLSSGVMTGFYFTEMTDLQYVAIAKLLGYDLNMNTNAQIMLSKIQGDDGSALSTNIGNNFYLIDNFKTIKDDNGETLSSHITKYAREYSVDEQLLYGIYANTGAIHGMNNDAIDFETCMYSELGCGYMGLKFEDEQDIMNSTNDSNLTGQVVTIGNVKINYKTATTSMEKSVKYAAAKLQYLFKKYDGNYQLAILAYNTPSQLIEKMLEQASKGTGMTKAELKQDDTPYWSLYRETVFAERDEQVAQTTDKIIDAGDITFVEKVLEYINGTNKFYVNGNLYDISNLRIATSVAQGKISANDIFLKRYETYKKLFDNAWHIMYLGQAGSYSTSFNPTNSYKYSVIQKPNVGDYTRNQIIKTIFAYENADEVSVSSQIDEVGLKDKYISLFSSSDAAIWTIDTIKEQLFPEEVPASIASSFSIVKTYGLSMNGMTGYTYHTDYTTIAAVGQEIKAMCTGEIIYLNSKNGEFSIECYVSPENYDIDAETNEIKKTVITYSGLKQLDSRIKIGANIQSANTVGIADTVTGLVDVGIAYGGTPVDANKIINVVHNIYGVNKYVFRNDYIGMNSKAKTWLQNYQKQAKALDSQFVKATEFVKPAWNSRAYVSARTWAYPSGSPHEAVDIAIGKGSAVVAPADGIVVNYYEGCPNDEGINAKCNGGNGNFVQMIFNKDGTNYFMGVWHINPGSVTKHLPKGYGETTFVIKQGQQFAETGNSGKSTGPHAHIYLINLGNGEISDAVAQYMKHQGTLWFGLNYIRTAKNRCEYNNYLVPCGERPEYIFGYKKR